MVVPQSWPPNTTTSPNMIPTNPTIVLTALLSLATVVVAAPAATTNGIWAREEDFTLPLRARYTYSQEVADVVERDFEDDQLDGLFARTKPGEVVSTKKKVVKKPKVVPAKVVPQRHYKPGENGRGVPGLNEEDPNKDLPTGAGVPRSK